MTAAQHLLHVEFTGEREMRMSREFDAPRDLVFRAYTEPEHLKRWWGRAGSTLSVCEVDLRPGGAWRFVERQSDGEEYAFHGVYREVLRPEALTYTFVFDPIPDMESIDALTFEDLGGRTLLRGISTFPTAEALESMRESGMTDGMRESMDRLEERLRQMAAGA